MNLTQDQIQFYYENGYLIVNNMFLMEEVASMKNGIGEFRSLTHLPSVISDDDGDIRSILAPHKSSSIFDRLYRDARLVNPSQQLVAPDLYLYQYKINLKKAFGGGLWEWHQDFPYWHYDDKIPEPEMISAMILLQDTRSWQGCLMVIPQSHKPGLAEMHRKTHLEPVLQEDLKSEKNLRHSLNNDLKFTIDHSLIRSMADDCGIINIEGPAGTCAFFHPNIFHASNTNVSPYNRDTVIVTYNSVTNAGNKNEQTRPEYVCSKDTSVVVACEGFIGAVAS